MPSIKPFFIAAAFTVTGCAAVTPHQNSDSVSLVEPEHITECTKLTTTNVGVTDQVGIYTRSDEAVKKDLITLGKNRAAEISGDSIVARGPVKEGKLSFDIYRCANSQKD